MNDEKTETLQAEIGQQLRAMRKKLNLTLEDVEELINKPYPEISLIETGKRKTNLHTLEQLASAYGYTVKIKFVKTHDQKTKKMKTLKEFQEAINNSTDGWKLEWYDLIYDNGWVDETRKEFGICNDGKERLQFNENRKAEIVEL